MSSALPRRTLAGALAAGVLLTGAAGAHAAVTSKSVTDAGSDTANLGTSAEVYAANKDRADVTQVTFSAETSTGGRLFAKVRVADHVAAGKTKVKVTGLVGGTKFTLTGTPQTGAISYGPVFDDMTCSSAARVDASATEDWITVSIPVACLPAGATAEKLRAATTYSAGGEKVAGDKTGSTSLKIRD